MKVLITVNTGMLDEGKSYNPGDTPDLSDEQAKEFIEKGWAVKAPEEEAASKKPGEVETAASKKPGETAVGRRQQ